MTCPVVNRNLTDTPSELYPFISNFGLKGFFAEDFYYVKDSPGHKSLENTEMYINVERTMFGESGNDDFTVKVAEDSEEIKALLDAKDAPTGIDRRIMHIKTMTKAVFLLILPQETMCYLDLLGTVYESTTWIQPNDVTNPFDHFKPRKAILYRGAKIWFYSIVSKIRKLSAFFRAKSRKIKPKTLGLLRVFFQIIVTTLKTDFLRNVLFLRHSKN